MTLVIVLDLISVPVWVATGAWTVLRGAPVNMVSAMMVRAKFNVKINLKILPDLMLC